MAGEARGSLIQRIKDDDYRTLAQFRLALRRYLGVAEAAANAAGIPPRQYQALLAIRGSAVQPTVGWMAEQLLVAPHTGLELARRLEAAGYIQLVPDSSDRRRRRLRLTAAAEQILDRLSAIHLAELRRDAPQLARLLGELAKTKRPR